MLFSSFELFDLSKPILVFGSDGQIGKALKVCFKDSKVPVVYLGRYDCDLASEASITTALMRYQPQIIINAAAYTDVDQAENEPDLALAINAHAPKVMAYYIANLSRGIFVQYSTDYVFADTKQIPYVETDISGPPDQLNVYGKTKLLAEQAIEEIFRLSQDLEGTHDKDTSSRYLVLRTSWVYGDGGNFIRTMLRLASGCDQMKVVADQVGVPTSAQWLASVTLQLLDSKFESGIYHAVPDGETSWHGLASFTIETAVSVGGSIRVKLENIWPIPAVHYPLPAKRPYNSRMNNQKLKQVLVEMSLASHYPHWKEQVAAYVKEYVVSLLNNKDIKLKNNDE